MNTLWRMLTFIEMENTIPDGLSLVRGWNWALLPGATGKAVS